MEGSTLWKEVIKAKYGEFSPCLLGLQRKPLSLMVWGCRGQLEIYGHRWRKTYTSRWEMVKKTRFWKDGWNPSQRSLPGFVSISDNPNARVGECWTDQGWDLSFRRLLNDWEVERVAELLGKLGGMNINTTVIDRVLLKHIKDGEF